MIESARSPSPEPLRQVEQAPEEFIETTTTKVIENPTDEEVAEYERAGTIVERSDFIEGSRAGSVAESHRPGKSHKSRKSKSRASTRQSRRSSSSESTATLRQSEVFDKTAALSIKSPSPPRSGHRGRSKSRARGGEIFIETRESRDDSGGTLVLPAREKSRSRRDIEEDIRRLEAEKKSIRHERRNRDDYETRSYREDDRDDDYDYVDDKEIRLEKNSTGQFQLERDAPKRSKSSRRPRARQSDVKGMMFSLT